MTQPRYHGARCCTVRGQRRAATLAGAVALIAALAGEVRAQDADGPVEANAIIDGTIIAGSLAATFLLMRIGVDTDQAPGPAWLGFDERVRRNFSKRTARVSDISLVALIASPLLISLSRPLDRVALERTAVYVEALTINLAINQIAKYGVQRPRPYTHSQADDVKAYAKSQGADAYLSFYSGHSSTSFAAAVAGSYLFALESDNETARAVVWGSHLALAAATAHWRVRAGRHYYSDIVVGAIIGVGVGVAVPRLHATDAADYTPTTTEWAAMAGGVALGVALSQLLPVDAQAGGSGSLAVLPMAVRGGAGLAVSGTLGGGAAWQQFSDRATLLR